ncbi:MetQ/NlpA family ABC transporter substrate-binding protein, partial [Staphylococcus epidermidis]|uniref:MetQ/NlpA family ABC transporter substrate-binding protein n=1 Tax=Staphylococcus epidermidis TaxID=1282 RepID=UPI0021B4C9C7
PLIINSNYPIHQKLTPKKHSIPLQSPKHNPYPNLIPLKKPHKHHKNIKLLIQLLQSKQIQHYIKHNYHGAVLPPN